MTKKNENLIYSAIGLVALFLILIAVNFLVARVPTRVDLTEGNLYTLSDGTRRILRGLESPVKVTLYMSQGEGVPVPLRGFAQRVEDLVREFKSAAGDRIVVERLNPRPILFSGQFSLSYWLTVIILTEERLNILLPLYSPPFSSICIKIA